ncbi:GSCOCG00007336001-RA-CDS [Cotesia congregata]|uniref:Similar to Lrmda: Leucine-rich melanocyte differentiation-associated protein (Mus musculus) n=1 Tax=Cotesia congregata TaxID=51543 RepID=A0A8J2E3N5_COTCN|nr:GSCOCG00007336001-RA-CDS [Cotesia congregata]CAG5076094.1 Similar to Lrmda: Leucine-rich melanocyte differentiation-associated protein (Mus musculus) [Cotesia congregata]
MAQDFNRSALTVSHNRACYTGQRSTRIPRGLIKIVGVNCVSLDLSYNELTSISALKECLCLEELILDNNKLYDLITLPVMEALTTISLNNNKLMDIDLALERISSCCPKVKHVSLLGNPGYPDQLTDPVNNDDADYDRYRLYAIHILPESLRFLDFRPVTPLERKDASNRGRFMRTIKLSITPSPSAPALHSNFNRNPNFCGFFKENVDAGASQERKDNYSPLPSTTRGPDDHKGAYGKCRYRYSGKNSEGNRFIINSDL